MTGPHTESDQWFEGQIRAMLHHRADLVTDELLDALVEEGRRPSTSAGVSSGPIELYPPRPARVQRRYRLALVAAAALVVAAVAATLVRPGNNDPVGPQPDATTPTSTTTSTTTPPSDAIPWVGPAPSADDLPDGVLTGTATVFEGGTDPVLTGRAYFDGRIQATIDVEASTIGDDHAALRWHADWTSIGEEETTGWLYVRRAQSERWSVVAATTDGVDTSGTILTGAGGSIVFDYGGRHDLWYLLVDPMTGELLDYETGVPGMGESGFDRGTLQLSPTRVDTPLAVDVVAVQIYEQGSQNFSISEYAFQLSTSASETDLPADVPATSQPEDATAPSLPPGAEEENLQLLDVVPLDSDLGDGWRLDSITPYPSRDPLVVEIQDPCPTPTVLTTSAAINARYLSPDGGTLTVLVGQRAEAADEDSRPLWLFRCPLPESGSVVEHDPSIVGDPSGAIVAISETTDERYFRSVIAWRDDLLIIAALDGPLTGGGEVPASSQIDLLATAVESFSAYDEANP